MTQSVIAFALVLQAATSPLPAARAAHPSPSPVSLRHSMQAPGLFAQPMPTPPRPRISTATRPRSSTRTLVGAVTGALAGGFAGIFVGAGIGARSGNDGDLTGAAVGMPVGALIGGILGGYYFGK